MKTTIVERGDLTDDYLDDPAALRTVSIGVVAYVSVIAFGWLMGTVVWELIA